MPVIQFQKELNINDLLQIAEQFNSVELEEFILKIQIIKQKKATNNDITKKGELISIIQRNFTSKEQARFNELVQKRQQYNITDDELVELIEMTDYSEQLSVERVKALGELSKITDQSVDVLMKELNVKPYQHAE